MITYKEIIKKLTSELDINEGQLADRLEVTQQTLSERKKKDATKYDDIIKLCLDESIDLNSLFQEDQKQIQQGFSISHPTNENGFINLSEAYNSWKIPNSMLQLFKIDKNYKFKVCNIQNNSMSPLINKYDSVIFRTFEQIESPYHKIYALKDGDLIIYKNTGLSYQQNNINVRRIYMIGKDRYLLKAEDNSIPSYEVSFSIDKSQNSIKNMNDIFIFGIVEKIIKNNI